MSDLLVAAPLRLEALAIKSGGRGLRVQKTGMGRARSHAAVARLLGDPAAALAVMGVCGGLDERCEPGDVVIAEELLDGEHEREGVYEQGSTHERERVHEQEGARGQGGMYARGGVREQRRVHEQEEAHEQHRESRGGDAGWWSSQPAPIVCPSAGPLAQALERRGVAVRVGTVVSVARIAHGQRRVELRERGGIVVDMESAWLAGGARGRPFAVIRVVADTPSREITRPLLTLAGAARAALSLRQMAAVLDELVREQGVHAVLGGGRSIGARDSLAMARGKQAR